MADFALSRRVILCFQLCGLHPINLSHMKDSQEVDGAMIKYRLYQLMHIIVVGANCIVVIFCPNSIMFANDPLGRFNDWIKYYAALFTSCLILTESYFRVRQLIEIFRLSGRLDGIFGSIRVDLSQESVTSYRVYIRKFLPFAAMLLLLEIWALPFFLTNTPMFNYWILTFPMLLQSRFRQLQHILYIDLCHHYARVLASNVKELAVFLNALEGTSGDSSAEYRRKFVNYRFRVLQRAHHVVWEISNCINTYFGWSQVANYAFHFLQLLADSYWLYYRFYNQSYGVGMCKSIGNLFHSSTILILCFYSSESCLGTIQSISIWLHRIKFTVYDGKISETLLNFSLQMIQEPVIFQAMELFPIDFKPLRSMISAITTYMVLFVQFLPRLVTSSYLHMD